MKDLLFLVADVWLLVVGFCFGWKFIRKYGNYMLGLEWIVVGVSASNFLVGSLLGADEGGVPYSIAYFLDAFSRSFGFTLVLVLGLMAVTHRYKPPLAVEIGAFGLAIVGGLYLGRFHDETLHLGPATFYLVVNLLTTLFLAYFAKRLWGIGARRLAIWTALVTAAATTIAITYDFFPFPFDDEMRTVFYTAALATWGAQGLVYYFAYRALHANNAAADAHRRVGLIIGRRVPDSGMRK
ncbi:transporter [Nocardia cyriacigeorgica]|uniref:Transporter n=1 Tax=Nocardia cyriacigeorgica TaxID=135487 RepID=A0A6P1DF76_9NOCA|nr:transporter [Nocardia cyriacigeorgica]NEW37835.1 transporter [Nocardia cyriacigeorgica]NEW47400.1 transporter [Nocardia cyriacigeorgica]NEW48780.1 transporter [Nocardia cyriacigeorgica]